MSKDESYLQARRMSRRTMLTCLVGTAGVGILVAACGDAPADESPPTTAPDGITPETTQAAEVVTEGVSKSGEILLAPEQQYGVGSGLEKVAELYMQENSGVTALVDIKPQQGYSDWARTQMSGGTRISMLTGSFLGDLIQADRFVDLLPYLEEDSPYTGKRWMDSFDQGTWSPDSPSGAMQQMNLMRTNVAWYYNKDLFREAGLDPDQPPTTWTELIGVAEELEASGILPFSIEGDYDGFWRMNIGWWRRLFIDSYIRDTVQITRSQPGDFNYREEVDGEWVYDPTDPYNDAYENMTNNNNRVLAAILDQEVVIDSDIYRDAYGHIKQLTQYADPGYFSLSRELARQAFITGRAAMWSDQPVFFALYEKIVDAEDAGLQRFDYGVFPYVDIDDSPLVQAKQRTFQGNLGFWVIPKKEDQQQIELEVDFFQFLTSPPIAREFMMAGLTQDGGDLVGPMPIEGVEMPEEWQQRFDQLTDIGPAGPNASAFGGALLAEQESAREYVDLTQRWFSDRLDEDEYFALLQKSFDDAVPRLINEQGLKPDTPEQQPTPRT